MRLPQTWHSLGATASKKFFRTHSQWQAAFNKYCVAAISLEQISWDAKFAYEDVLVQLLKKEKASSSGIFLVVLYDDLFRRQLARRALSGEPELDINKCFQSRDDTILEAARVRLTPVLVSAGLVPVPTSLATTRNQQLTQDQQSQVNWQKVNGEWVSNKAQEIY